MNEPSPVPPAAPVTLEDAIKAIANLTTVVEVQGKSIVALNDALGKVARFSGMMVLNGREKMDG